jgi:hypothetical protein
MTKKAETCTAVELKSVFEVLCWSELLYEAARSFAAK